MSPSKDDVQAMVSALMSVAAGIERAKREGKAATLALLYVLAERAPIRPSDLSLELGAHPSSVTRQVQALEAEGQVVMTADPDDGRSCFISLTDAGREEMHRLTQIGLARFAAFVADWEADDVRKLAHLLARLQTSMAEVNRRQPPPGGSWRERKERR
jgi:DNA-binding MarR family transcriptional regulator